MNLAEIGTYSFLLPALLAGMVVLSTHVPLGREVLRRGIVFLDLAVAQIAALGLLAINQLPFLHEDDALYPLLKQLAAVGAAMLGASILYAFKRYSAVVQEALIGTAFMLAASGAILMLAADPHGGERLKELLAGQILWVDYSSVVMVALVYALFALCMLRSPLAESGYLFYLLFAVAVTLSTQLVGVYLVFASLIIPALAGLNARRPWVTAYGVGGVGYVLGLVLSVAWDLPTGALTPWTLAAVAVCVVLIRDCVLNRQSR